MDELENTPEPVRRQKKRMRFFWFLAGSVVNYVLISTPFSFLKAHTSLPIWGISACAFGVSTGFFFIWNYFINFRTERRKREAFPRYLAAVSIMWLLSSSVLTMLKSFDAHMSFLTLDLDIVATQFFLAGLKFFLYHRWVFPLPLDEDKECLPDTPQEAD